MKLKFFAHSAFQITTNDGVKILIDPFLNDNPKSPVKADEVDADYIILTHAHGDHIGDSLSIAKRCGSKFITTFELMNYLSEKGFEGDGMSIGGGKNFDFGRVKLVQAFHGSVTPDQWYGGQPSGVLITIDGKTVYHTGDTALFGDMKLIGEMNPVDYMLLPIGDYFTMGIDDAVKAVELTSPKVAIPMHYNTFPLIEANAGDFKARVEQNGGNVMLLDYGQEIEL